jgi:hypothetical protein
VPRKLRDLFRSEGVRIKRLKTLLYRGHVVFSGLFLRLGSTRNEERDRQRKKIALPRAHQGTPRGQTCKGPPPLEDAHRATQRSSW